MIRRIPLAALAAATIALTLSACATTAEPESTPTPTPTPTSTPAETAAATPEPTAEHEPEPEPEPTDAAPTCETIIASSTVTALTEHGWTHQDKEFRVGSDVIEGGIQCVWGDFTVASDHVQIFGWAPIDQAASNAAQQKLFAEGWQRADSDGHTYITENPDFAIAVDEDGFGMTYEFGAGWVKLADTRQGLVLVQFD